MLRQFCGAVWAVFIASTIVAANVVFVCVSPLAWLAPSIYKRFARTIPAMLWPSLVWSLETWSGNRLHFYGEEPESEESAIVIANHQYYCDFLIMFALALRVHMLDCFCMVLKGSLKWIPFVGNALSAIGFVFLSRSWETDKTKLKAAFSSLKSSEFGFWLASHPEGTRLTPRKLEESNSFAKSKGMSPMRNILLPRVKGFYAALSSLREEPSSVIDMTIAYENRPANPFGFIAGLSGNPTTIHVHVRRFPFDSIPQGEENVSRWLYDRYAEKDKLLQSFKDTGKFGTAPVIFKNSTPSTGRIFMDIIVWYLMFVSVIIAQLWIFWMCRPYLPF